MQDLDLEAILQPGEQLDILKNSGLKIIQNRGKFMFGIDAYLLADFAEIRNEEVVVDFGTGTGIIPLLVSGGRAKYIHALELQEESADMAKRSVALNGLEEKITIVQGNIKDAQKIFGGNFCNVVVSNPPYMKTDTGKLNPSEAKNIARHEIFCNLEDVIKEASKILKSNGRFYMIHRPERLSEIFVLFEKYKFAARRLRNIFPAKDKKATMILIEGRKTGSSDLKIEPPLIVYETPGKYTTEVEEIYSRL